VMEGSDGGIDGGTGSAAGGTDVSFEALYNQLEQAVSRLESGGLGLEESIAMYESGMRLAQQCKAMLDAAELRVCALEEEMSRSVTDTSPFRTREG
jgi:exodeoxyribonuclease VII small subunit